MFQGITPSIFASGLVSNGLNLCLSRLNELLEWEPQMLENCF